MHADTIPAGFDGYGVTRYRTTHEPTWIYRLKDGRGELVMHLDYDRSFRGKPTETVLVPIGEVDGYPQLASIVGAIPAGASERGPLAERLHAARIAARMQLRALAAVMGESPATVSAWECGKEVPGDVDVRTMAVLLDGDPGEWVALAHESRRMRR